MLTPRVRVAGIAAALLLLFGAGMGLWFAEPRPAQAAEAKDAKLKNLLKERLALLKEIATQSTVAYKGGQASMEEVYRAHLAVLKAELDLCESDKERIGVLEKIVELAKEQEKHAAKLAAAHSVSGRDVLQAKVGRLEAEIALERARAK